MTTNHAPRPRSNHWKWLRTLIRFWWIPVIVAGIIAVTYIVKQVTTHPPLTMKVEKNTRIDITPEELQAIKQIGQWEFLAISTEELTEWHAHSHFSNSHLVRIYKGTLRIGIDLTRAKDDWFVSLPDSTAQLTLPPVGLLDTNFIDETATRSFYQKGKIPTAAYAQLYAQAKQAMMRRCLTKENLAAAEEGARKHFTRLFEALGFKKVLITFTPTTQPAATQRSAKSAAKH